MNLGATIPEFAIAEVREMYGAVAKVTGGLEISLLRRITHGSRSVGGVSAVRSVTE
jgi:hypothetical protein